MAEQLTRAERREATAARILEAAQVEFGAHGIEGATIRGIARRAGVDPSLVLQHYGSKQGLFTLAVSPAPDLEAGDVPEHLAEVLNVRLRELPPATRALLRSMLTSPEAAEVMTAYLEDRVQNLARATAGPDAELRAALLVAGLVGITVVRHFTDLPALKGVDPDRLSAIAEPWFAALVPESSPGPSDDPEPNA